MRHIKILLLNVAIFSFSFLACSQVNNFDEMIDNTISGTVQLFYPDSNYCETCLYIDARKEEEYNVSHIPNSLFVEYSSFKVKDLNKVDKDQTIVVYCTVGYRSEKIGEKLIKAGYKDVYNMYGGIFEWKNTGHEVVDNEGNETEKVHCYNKEWSKWLVKGEKVY